MSIDRLEFPDTPSRLVAARATGRGSAESRHRQKCDGFARRVTSVTKMPPKIIVMTTAPAIGT